MVSVSLASNDFVAIGDSDNVFTKGYVDALFALDYWYDRTIYSPCFAAPHFDYSHFAGQTINRQNVAEFIPKFKFDVLVNCMNYVVNRNEYLRIFDYGLLEPYAADSIIQNYNWWNAGNSMYIVPKMQYTHTVHEGSHYKEHIGHSKALATHYENKLKELR
jgi:hypothetical protein